YQHCGWDTEAVASLMTPAVPVVAIGPATLPDGVVTGPYSVTLSGSNGTGQYAFSVTSGTLPPGITLSQSGALTGTPTKGGTFTLSIGWPALVASPQVLPPAVRRVAYQGNLGVSGGSAPYSFAQVSGSLPAGLTLGADGTITGVPTGAAGTFDFNVAVTDHFG